MVSPGLHGVIGPCASRVALWSASSCSIVYGEIVGKNQPSTIERIAAHKGPFTVKELAAILRVSVRSVYNAIKDDGLPVIKIGGVIRIDPVHAANWLRERKVG